MPKGKIVRWFESSFDSDVTSASTKYKRPQKRQKRGDIVREDNESKQSQSIGDPFRSQSIGLLDSMVTEESSSLALSGQKLKQLRQWFCRQFIDNTSTSKFLVLNGPTGAGKTTSLKVLAKEFKVEVIEYKEYNQEFETIIDENLNEKRENYLIPMNQIENFKNFIASSVNYKNRLDFESSDGVLGSSSKTVDHRLDHRLVLIEEFPNVFHSKPEALHKELRLLKKKKRLIPIVFIISETINGQSNEYRLLPKGLKEELNMEIINFKSITDRVLQTSLQRLTNSQLSTKAIESVIDGSSGDIRSAINNLQLLEMHSNNYYSNNKSTKLAKVRQKVAQNNSFVSRDPSLTIHHAIGKVLYAKRIESEDKTNTDGPQLDSVDRLPQHLRDKERVALKDNPDGIADKLVLSSDHFNGWLHQNYIDFCDDSFERAQPCIDWLCESDALFSGEHHFYDKPVFESYKSSLAIRGLMFNLSSNKGSNDAKQASNELNSKPNRGFKPFKKPQSFVNNLLAESLKRQITQSKPLKTHFCTTDSLVVDLIPFITQMPKHLQKTDNEVKFVLNQIVSNRRNGQNNEQDLCYALSESSIANTFSQTNDEIIFQTNTNDEQKDGNIVQIDCQPIDDNDYRIEDSD